MPFKDREVQLAAQRAHYRRNSAAYYARLVARREQRRALISDIKVRRGCQNCGENHPAVLDFHHRDEDFKVMNISKMVQKAFSLKRIMVEIDKCDVLCANCHRKYHWENG